MKGLGEMVGGEWVKLDNVSRWLGGFVNIILKTKIILKIFYNNILPFHKHFIIIL